MPMALKPMMERFWSNVKVKSVDECWVYGTHSNKKRYPTILEAGRGSKCKLVHRLSYEVHKGEIPTGLVVMHTCDNPPCVNPNHLQTGTNEDNNKDKDIKGRHGKTGPQAGTGVRNNLTSLQLIALKEDAKIMTQQKLSVKYGIGQSTVSLILIGKSCQNII